MTIQEAHYHFKLYFDRLDTSAKPDYNAAEIDYFLNEAQLIWLNQRYSPKLNRLASGFEMTQKRTDELSTLVVKFPLQAAITPTSLGNSTYEVNLSNLAYPYLHFISATAIVQGDSCKYHATVRISSHDSLYEDLEDPFTSSIENGVLATFGKSSDQASRSIFIYSTLPVLEVRIDYIKLPRRVSLGTYTYLDGIQYPPTTFEFPDATHQSIVDLACQIASLSQENPNDVQIKLAKLNIQ